MDYCDVEGDCIRPVYVLAAVGLLLILFFALMISLINIGYRLPKMFTNVGTNTWAASHFILYFIIGLIYPCCFVPAMLVGIAWEFIEWYLGQTMPPMCPGLYKSDCRQYWYGQITDVAVNAVGFIAGASFRLLILNP